jgi:hypothetical protein
VKFLFLLHDVLNGPAQPVPLDHLLQSLFVLFRPEVPALHVHPLDRPPDRLLLPLLQQVLLEHAHAGQVALEEVDGGLAGQDFEEELEGGQKGEEGRAGLDVLVGEVPDGVFGESLLVPVFGEGEVAE